MFKQSCQFWEEVTQSVLCKCLIISCTPLSPHCPVFSCKTKSFKCLFHFACSLALSRQMQMSAVPALSKPHLSVFCVVSSYPYFWVFPKFFQHYSLLNIIMKLSSKISVLTSDLLCAKITSVSRGNQPHIHLLLKENCGQAWADKFFFNVIKRISQGKQILLFFIIVHIYSNSILDA